MFYRETKELSISTEFSFIPSADGSCDLRVGTYGMAKQLHYTAKVYTIKTSIYFII